jgi:hypothetical protein
LAIWLTSSTRAALRSAILCTCTMKRRFDSTTCKFLHGMHSNCGRGKTGTQANEVQIHCSRT